MKRKVSLMIIVILLLQVLLPLLTVIWESDFTVKSEAAGTAGTGYETYKQISPTINGIKWEYYIRSDKSRRSNGCKASK